VTNAPLTTIGRSLAACLPSSVSSRLAVNLLCSTTHPLEANYPSANLSWAAVCPSAAIRASAKDQHTARMR